LWDIGTGQACDHLLDRIETNYLAIKIDVDFAVIYRPVSIAIVKSVRLELLPSPKHTRLAPKERLAQPLRVPCKDIRIGRSTDLLRNRRPNRRG